MKVKEIKATGYQKLRQRYQNKLKLQHQTGLYRNPTPIERREGKVIYCHGRRLINFASNDYLGLGASEALHHKVAANFERYGSSSSSSRLVAGNYVRLIEAEQAFADFFGYEAALFFPSGYQANLGVLSALFESDDIVLFDKHIHASSVKGLALSGATCLGYNHNNMAHLKKRIAKHGSVAALITESLFSMDGDMMDRKSLIAFKKRCGFFCIVDEAHALGVLGPQGKGIAVGLADLAVGTFGKALGLFGAFVLLPAEIKDYLLNFSSPQIYTTALPEAHAASTLDVLEFIAISDDKRRHLSQLGSYLRQALKKEGFRVSGDAHIFAIEIGDETRAANIAQALFNRGVFVLPARYPTVPLQKAILRISLTAQHQMVDLDYFLNAIKEIYETFS